MKTPRQLLLERHQAVQPQLEAIRREVLRSALNPAAPRTAPPEAPASWREWPWGWWRTLERELFWSCRRAWMGLAAAWVAILLLNGLAGRFQPEPVLASVPPIPPEERLAMQQAFYQAQADLAEPRAEQPAGTPQEKGKALRPRSQRTMERNII